MLNAMKRRIRHGKREREREREKLAKGMIKYRERNNVCDAFLGLTALLGRVYTRDYDDGSALI